LKVNCPKRQRGTSTTERNESTMFLGMLREHSMCMEIGSKTMNDDDGWEHVPIKSNRWVMVEDIKAQEVQPTIKSTKESKLCWADWCESSEEEDDEDESTNGSIEEVFMTTGSSTSGSNRWLADTGSTVHCTNDESYLPNKEKC
jgi:hypothetical protein